ncbi:MAG: TetR/AcrR family transcriptional regulator [Chloroflexota bacterium]
MKAIEQHKNGTTQHRGQNRQKQRMERAIVTSFVELVREKGYEHLTVSDIADHANVGRTTFYRHFENKAGILVKLHRSRFEKLNIAPATREAWLTTEPNPDVVALLERAQHTGRFQTLLYRLGAEVSVIQKLIDDALTDHFEMRLRLSFAPDELHTPLPMLARSLAGSFSWMIRWWVEDAPDHSPTEVAAHMQAVMVAAIRQAIGGGSATHEGDDDV